MMNKKGDVRILVEAIVAIIIAFVVLTLSLYFIDTETAKVEETAHDVFFSSLSAGSRNLLEISLEEKGFAISKRNFNLKKGAKETFYIAIKNFDTVDESFSVLIDSNWFLRKQNPIKIAVGYHIFFPVLIKIPTDCEPKTYFYQLDIKAGDNIITSEIIEVSVEENV